MAVTQVRAQINGTWYTLALDSATGKYYVDLIMTSASSSQPGGYFPVTVEASSNLAPTVTLSGENYPGLRLVVEDTIAPTLIVTAPIDGLVTATDSVTVTGTAFDTSGLSSVTVNDSVVTVAADGSFSTSVSLSEGDNTITVTAVDIEGNAITETRTVYLDTIQPEISIISPTAGQMVKNSSFTVTGTVSDINLTSVTVNGTSATVIDGTFSLDITLTEGDNSIIATATDSAGNTATATASVLLDTIPPTLIVSAPVGNLITNTPTLTVSGTASDGGSGMEEVTVNGQSVTLTDGAFSKDFTLMEGTNTITISATDKVGHVTTVTRSVLLDTDPPVLTLVSPPEGFIKESQPMVIFSVVDEPGGSGVNLDTVSVLLDGVLQSDVSISDGTISFTPTLSDGSHIITITVDDMAGNHRWLSVSYTVDTAPPVLYIKAPYMRHVVDDETVEIVVNAYDDGTGVSRVTAGNQNLTLDGKNSYKGAIPLSVGENTITVTAYDQSENQTDCEIYMIRLITDRTNADVNTLKTLYERGMAQWTETELNWFNTAIVRGAYNNEDLNRVNIAIDFLANELKKRGYISDVMPKMDWVNEDVPTQSQMQTYLQNVDTVRTAQKFPVSEIPITMQKSTIDDWNNIEKALVETDEYFPNYFSWTSGELSSGES